MLSDSYRNSLGYDCAFYLIKEKNNSKILLIYNYGSVLSIRNKINSDFNLFMPRSLTRICLYLLFYISIN